jgi:ABC-type nitrate/sulfonate/bicarbonate transport system permease component
MNRRIALVIDLFVLLALWHIAAESLNRPFLPTPTKVIETFFSEMGKDLPEHIWVSTWRVVVSVVVGAGLSAPLAIIIAQNPVLDMILSPLVYFLYPAPKIVFLPLIILFLGLGSPSIMFLIGFIIFFQVFVIVRDAAVQVAPETLDSVRSLGANRWHTLRHVYIPLSIPAVLTALKVSIGTAIAVLFIAESIGNNVGLGYYIIVEQWNRYAYPKVYAGILAMSLLALGLFLLLTLLERRLSPWHNNGLK